MESITWKNTSLANKSLWCDCYFNQAVSARRPLHCTSESLELVSIVSVFFFFFLLLASAASPLTFPNESMRIERPLQFGRSGS